MSALSNRLTALQERAQDSLSEMSPRDRNLALGLVGFGTLAVVVLGIWWMRSTLGGLGTRLEDARFTLQRVQMLATDQASNEAKASQIKADIQKWGSTDLSTFLEQAAQKAQVGDHLDQVKEKSTTVEGSLESKLYAVRLTQLDQNQLGGFLYEAETAGYPLKVESIKVKTKKRDNQVFLDVDLDISTFRIVEQAAEAG